MKSVVVMGRGSLAIRITEFFANSPEWHLAAVIPSLPEPAPMASIVSAARARNWPLVESGKLQDLHLAEDIPFDLGFSCFYNRIIAPDQLNLFKRCLNIHNSPLPAYRGVAPINWALENGEKYHGVTIHEIDLGIDTGPILAQMRFAIDSEIDEVLDVYRRCLHFGWSLFESLADNLTDAPASPQPAVGSSYFGTRDKERLRVRTAFTRNSQKPEEVNGL